ncbi:hypothetical protein FSP39_002243 [Pinctada imbricata]|uniref:TBC1 domain family member 7 n=1 Tax=Pinctada imbricata TaxID=66713 RepID=A0AA89C4W2_PINIB|nr:hypothetical protein FSP39_002243 [Pinctada imbricata]
MSDERNFRTYYYEKFGISGVEEKKSLEILLKEQPLCVEKIRQFCLRFQVPSVYRCYLWKVVLGILPSNQESHAFVMSQRKQKYEDLRNAVKVMRLVKSLENVPQLYLKMFLLETGQLTFEEHNMETPENEAFKAMVDAVSCSTEDPVDVYWITVRFYKMFNRCTEGLNLMTDRVASCLKKEDTDGKLWNHFQTTNVWSSIPLNEWYICSFAGVLPDTSFERIWDKIIGGSCTILVYVAVSVFLTFKRPLLSMKKKEDMLKYLSQLPEDSGDIIVTKALDLWHKHGGHLIQTKSDSPVFTDRAPS